MNVVNYQHPTFILRPPHHQEALPFTDTVSHHFQSHPLYVVSAQILPPYSTTPLL